MVVGDAHVFPGSLTSILTQLSFPSHRLLFSHAPCRGEWWKHAGKKVCLNMVWNSQPPIRIDWLHGVLCRFQQYLSHIMATAHIKSFLDFTSTRLGLWSVLSNNTPTKILWEKEKMLVNSIFFFSHGVFKSFLSRYHSNLGPPRWLSGKHVKLMTWWLWVRYPVKANFLSGVFSPLTSAETC